MGLVADHIDSAGARHELSLRADVVAKAWDEKGHPRGFDGRWVPIAFGSGFSYDGIVHAHVPRGEPFAGTHVADVQQVHEDGTATVSLHLDASHPAVRDAMADGVIGGPDQGEWITRVDLARVKGNNDTMSLKAPAKRLFEREAARGARRARVMEETRNREAHRRGEIPSGPKGMIGMDELDHARRLQYS
jgi:hypothetical protein